MSEAPPPPHRTQAATGNKYVLYNVIYLPSGKEGQQMVNGKWPVFV